MPSLAPVITLLTDFGHRDPYVAVMKGQILKSCPHAVLVDLTHEVDPGDIRGASYQLDRAVDYFPPMTVHLVVVDPGVGTDRAMLAVRCRQAFYVAPDNGVLSRVLRRLGPASEVATIPVLAYASATFHGRDIMAPAAARLALGEAPLSLGGTLEWPVMLKDEPPLVSDALIEANVLAVDHFGNVTLDLDRVQGEEYLTLGSRWIWGMQELCLSKTYADVDRGKPLLLWSSDQLLELACCGVPADSTLGVRVGDRVTLRAAHRAG